MSSEQEGRRDAAGDEDPRRQLWIRAGIAGGLIAVLLGGLALFDHLSRPPQPEEVALPTKPIAPAQISDNAGRDAPPDVVRAGEVGASDAAPAVSPEGSAPPRLPESEADGGRLAEGTRPLVRPAAPVAQADSAVAKVAGETPAAKPGVTAAGRPATPVTAPRPPETGASPAVAAPTPSARPAPSAQTPAAVPPVAATPAAPAVLQKPVQPATVESAQGYVLQFGFFSSVASAEALKARLAQAGVPSQIETRLIVGPFADRREALAAQARLREKGVDSGMLLPLGR